MKKQRICGWTLIFLILFFFPACSAQADGGYFSRRAVAVSADQRAIIIKKGNEISMTFSTGYTGEGEDFGWIIPAPVPPTIEDVSEAGEEGEEAFRILDEYTAPAITVREKSGGCFPAGTEVLTGDGPRAIETVNPGTEVYGCDPASGKWMLQRVRKLQTLRYQADMIAIEIGQDTIRATGNHPFYVLSGDRLASRPLPVDIPTEEQETSGAGRWVEARDP